MRKVYSRHWTIMNAGFLFLFVFFLFVKGIEMSGLGIRMVLIY